MRIVAGAWRGRALAAPAGNITRPSADRVRQTVFDMLLHAPWGGRGRVEGQRVLDVFAGTGAFGLEALSRGAAQAVFLERDRAALAALRANIAVCRAEAQCQVLPADALRPPRGEACGLVFLDPPYGQGLVPLALAALRTAGWLAPDALIVAEAGRDEAIDLPMEMLAEMRLEMLAERTHGAARIWFWRLGGDAAAG